MSIQYWKPVEEAYGRMKTILFAPFNPTKWLVIGFSAWLAHIFESSFNFQFNLPSPGTWGTEDPWAGALEQFLTEHLAIVVLLFLVIFFVGMALALVFLWLSARFRFIFLDHVVGNRTELAAPWNRYARRGNSLFLWWAVFGLAAMVLMIALVVPIILLIIQMAHSFRASQILIIAVLVMFMFLFMMAFQFVLMLLRDFIIPIMYKHDLMTMDAWRRFMPCLRHNIGPFVLYTLLRIGLNLGIGLVMIVLVILTCCCAAILLAIPYVGAVLLLPIHVFFRAFSLYFLRQFGEDLDVLQEGAQANGATASCR